METTQAYRICVYVPSGSLDDFIKAIGPHIPSFLGNYDHVCWWSEAGIEQFRQIGSGDIKQKQSHRVEMSIPLDEATLHSFINEIVIPIHPWDEPVITITEQKIVKHVE